MPRVAVNGISLHYEEAGSGSPLLFIHAFPVGRRMWEPQIAALARRHRVIAYDVRAFDLSDAPHASAAYSQALSVGRRPRPPPPDERARTTTGAGGS
jgi:pimeloyl-ACP methyl ester carboxylesterase